LTLIIEDKTTGSGYILRNPFIIIPPAIAVANVVAWAFVVVPNSITMVTVSFVVVANVVS